jgi:hypothetical protein
LSNGNYVVSSPYWDRVGATDAGAVTWGSGTAGVSGVVSVGNSLIGSTTSDWIGNDGVTALSNGNYVVSSQFWDDGGTANVGAVTWGSGTTGISGSVLVGNSLVGSADNDRVGTDGVTALSNGNYVVSSRYWDYGPATDAGAVTWGSGVGGINGAVSVTNSLIGSTNDQVGNGGVTALTNGHYVVSSPDWDNGGTANVGAVTWGSGTIGISGSVSTANSLVGSSVDDQVGSGRVTALSNGHYVVCSLDWDGVDTDVGAVTWGSGTAGISGAVSAANSLVGSTASDRIGATITVLSNGNYVVRSPGWSNGLATNAGAVTWGSGTAGISGAVSAANSLVGSTASDMVGVSGVTALSNGNYVVSSRFWDGSVANAGAVTWGSGTSGINGAVSTANSLVGSSLNDRIGGGGVTALNNGNYVVRSPSWNSDGAVNAGAVTWGSGTAGVSGAVSAANSLVGSTANDGVGDVTALSNGHYVVSSPDWDNGGVADVGAVTWGSGTAGASGTITVENSVLGQAGGGGSSLIFDYDYAYNQLVVGRPADNRVTIFTSNTNCYLPLIIKNGS